MTERYNKLGQIDLGCLDQCIETRSDLERVMKVLRKVERCCGAVDQHMNLADVVQDPANLESLQNVFGPENYDKGIELMVKVALSDYERKSFIVDQAIEGKRKLDFCHKSVGGWKQFDGVLALHLPSTSPHAPIFLLDPSQERHWDELGSIPAGTLVTVFLKTVNGKRTINQERLALDRYETLFDMVANRSDLEGLAPPPAIQMDRHENSSAPRGAQSNGKTVPISQGKRKPQGQKTAARRPRRSTAPRIKKAPSMGATGGKLSFSFRVVINKMDTFVHAGNAQLIIGHIQNFPGRVQMYVLRGEKETVQLDADTIWGKEIRNGETVLYEFYGATPEEDFVKELANRTNKYTQMDKVANE